MHSLTPGESSLLEQLFLHVFSGFLAAMCHGGPRAVFQAKTIQTEKPNFNDFKTIIVCYYARENYRFVWFPSGSSQLLVFKIQHVRLARCLKSCIMSTKSTLSATHVRPLYLYILRLTLTLILFSFHCQASSWLCQLHN